VWVDGVFYKSNQEQRERVIDDWEHGRIKVVWNRFVMREGLDFPWLKHLILATPIGSLTSYIQTVGRVLRYWPHYDEVILQDHGGNYWRHGSPNEQRPWHDLWKYSAKTITDIRLDKQREKPEETPIECPMCHTIRYRNPQCPKCGHMHTSGKRMVLQADGKLKPLNIKELKQRRRKHEQRNTGRDGEARRGFHRLHRGFPRNPRADTESGIPRVL